jgi:hypothetical protein
MLTSVDESEILFEWDLQNIDLSQVLISPEFSFQESKYYIHLCKKEVDINYACALQSVETLGKPGKNHFRFDLVKRLDNAVVKSYQTQRDLKELHKGWGPVKWIDPVTIHDHILKVKIWTSEYHFENDLENINVASSSFALHFFIIGDNELLVRFKKNEGGSKYDCLLKDANSAISSKVRFQVDLFAKLDNRLVKSDKCEFFFNKTDVGRGFEDWFDVDTIRDHILKGKVLIYKPFSDFVESPAGFETHGSLLFEKTSSNLSFLVGDKVVHALQSILTSRSDYFRAMLEGSFVEAQVPMTLESKIPIQGVDVDLSR